MQYFAPRKGHPLITPTETGFGVRAIGVLQWMEEIPQISTIPSCVHKSASMHEEL